MTKCSIQRGSTLCGALAIALLASLLLASPPAHAASTASDLCTGDPCRIQVNHDIVSGSVLDFGNRRVVLSSALDVEAGDFTLLAGSLLIKAGGQIKAKGGTADFGGSVSITTTDGLEFEDGGNTESFLMTGCDGGSLSLASQNGPILGEGSIKLSRVVLGFCAAEGSGGDLSIVSGGDILLGGTVEAIGGSDGCGGTLDIFADGNVRVSRLDASGGDCDGGLVTVDADGAIELGRVDADGGGESGAGGEIVVSSLRSVVVDGPITARGSANIQSGGDGGIFEVSAGSLSNPQLLWSRGEVALNGRGPDGCGGFLLYEGMEILSTEEIQIRGNSGSSCGGAVDMLADRSLTIEGRIRADAGFFGGSSVTLSGGTRLELSADVDANARGAGGSAGEVLLSAEIIDIDGAITANATNGATLGGDVEIEGCRINIDSDSTIEATGPSGGITVAGSGPIRISGSFDAGPESGNIAINYRDAAEAPNLSGATFGIPQTVSLDGNLRPCAIPECLDRSDNDDDGRMDWPLDPDCQSPYDPSEVPDCRDGIDNDQDGSIDYPADPGCLRPDQQLERTACDDGVDNDGDGFVDWDGGGIAFPDPNCIDKPGRTFEQQNCGLGFEIGLALPLLLLLRRRRRA